MGVSGSFGTPDMDTLLEHRPFVEAIARRLLRDEHLVEDVVQETWLATLAGPPSLRSMRAWLNRVTRNLGRRAQRARARRERCERPAGRAGTVPDAAALFERLELHKRVVEAVSRLDPKSRTVILLRFYEDLSPREIAQRTGIPPSTVRTRLARALATLRGLLDRDCGGDGRSWAIALLPLLKPMAPGKTGAALGGTLAMKKVVACIAALALLLTGLVVWRTSPKSDPAAARSERTDAQRPSAHEDAAGTRGQAVVDTTNAEGAQQPKADAPTPPADRAHVATVRTDDGQPLRGAVLDIGNDPALRGTTDAEGRLRLEGTWEGSRELMIRASDGSWFLTTGVFATAGGAVDVSLQRGHVLTTTVVAREGGAPVPGARVFMGRSDLAGSPGQAQGVWARGDAEGRVRIEFLPSALYRFEVRASGYESRQGNVHLGEESFPARVELAPARSLTVRLVGLAPGFDGREVRGFVQRVGGGMPQWFREKLDARGEFRIPAPPRGGHGLVVEAGEVAPRLSTTLSIKEGDLEPVVLTVPSGASWSSIVRAADGTPWANAPIRVDGAGTLRTDDRGFVRFMALSPGKKKVVAIVPNGWFALGEFEVADQGTVHGDLTLPGSAGVRARVMAGDKPQRTPIILHHRTRPELYAYQISDGDGRIRFDHLAAGTYSIETRGATVVKLRTTTLRDGEVTDVGTLQLGNVANVAVQVSVPEGAKMPRGFHAYATIRSPDGQSREQVALVWLAADGKGTLAGLPAGTHTVRVSTPGFEELELTLTVPAAKPVRIALQPAPAKKK